MGPCPTTTTPCATTMANPCETTAKFMGKYASKTVNGITSAADDGPRLGGQSLLALAACVLCAAALVAFGAFRVRATRTRRSTRSCTQDEQEEQEALIPESVPREVALE